MKDLKAYITSNSVINQSDCWRWKLSLTADGFGQASNGRQVKAHRLSYEAFNGPIPPATVIDHTCKNKWCVNPAHLLAISKSQFARQNPNLINPVGHVFPRCPICHKKKLPYGYLRCFCGQDVNEYYKSKSHNQNS